MNWKDQELSQRKKYVKRNRVGREFHVIIIQFNILNIEKTLAMLPKRNSGE